MPIPQDSLGPVGALFAPVVKDVAAIAATTTTAVTCAPLASNERYRVNRAEILVDATYAADPANFYVFTLAHNGTTVATWSTQTAAQGVLTTLVVNEMVMAADTGVNRVVQPGEVLTLTATKNGTAANFTGRFIVHGRFV